MVVPFNLANQVSRSMSNDDYVVQEIHEFSAVVLQGLSQDVCRQRVQAVDPSFSSSVPGQPSQALLACLRDPIVLG